MKGLLVILCYMKTVLSSEANDGSRCMDPQPSTRQSPGNPSEVCVGGGGLEEPEDTTRAQATKATNQGSEGLRENEVTNRNPVWV